MKKMFFLALFLPLFSFVPCTNDQDVFFGDSIIFGNELGPQQYTARWSSQYCRAVPTDEYNAGLSGAAMTPGLNAGRPVFNIDDVPVYESRFRHIFISYWGNDYVYGGTSSAYQAATTNAVNGIIAKGWPPAKIVLCFNYYPEVTVPRATALEWQAALRSVQNAKGTSFLDFYTLIYNRPDKGSYADDDVHPTVAWNGIMKDYALTSIEGPPPSTLPVTFSSFSGQRQNTANVLKWTVATEQAIVRYDVMRSADGAAWVKIGEVASLGNTGTERSYGFTDKYSGAGKQLYRLQAIGTDGSIKVSSIVIINGSKAGNLSLGGLFPNPASSTLNLVVNAPVKETVTLLLSDALGRSVKSRRKVVEAGANTVDVNLSDVKAGVYFIKVIADADGSVAVERFLKE